MLEFLCTQVLRSSKYLGGQLVPAVLETALRRHYRLPPDEHHGCYTDATRQLSRGM